MNLRVIPFLLPLLVALAACVVVHREPPGPATVHIPAGGKAILLARASGRWIDEGVVDDCRQRRLEGRSGALVVQGMGGSMVFERRGLRAGTLVRFCGAVVHLIPPSPPPGDE